MLQYLVRHGESVSNVEERVQGQADVELSALSLRLRANCREKRKAFDLQLSLHEAVRRAPGPLSAHARAPLLLHLPPDRPGVGRRKC
jgi:bisphosphoglycerate-dependent phosphoglycerate mutase